MNNFVQFDLQLKSNLSSKEILDRLGAALALPFRLDESYDSEGLEIFEAVVMGHQIRFCPLGIIDDQYWYSLSCRQGDKLDDMVLDDFKLVDFGNTYSLYLKEVTKLDWTVMTEDDFARIEQIV